MWNNDSVCGGRMVLKILVRDSSDIWKSLKSNYGMMFADPLVCWDCKDTSLLMRVQSNHSDAVFWVSYLTGSNDFLYIHPRLP